MKQFLRLAAAAAVALSCTVVTVNAEPVMTATDAVRGVSRGAALNNQAGETLSDREFDALVRHMEASQRGQFPDFRV